MRKSKFTLLREELEALHGDLGKLVRAFCAARERNDPPAVPPPDGERPDGAETPAAERAPDALLSTEVAPALHTQGAVLLPPRTPKTLAEAAELAADFFGRT